MSVRLLMSVGLVLAITVPVLLVQALPGGAAAWSGRGALIVVLGQLLLSGAVLLVIWWGVVHRSLSQIHTEAQALAGVRAPATPPLRMRWRPGKSALDQLAHSLYQAQRRSRWLARELAERHRDLHRMAMYDALTGLPNRRLFRDLLARAAAKSRRTGQPMTLLFIDLDRFKEVNDRFGHPAGDELLSTIGQRLVDTMRRADLVGRLGGDEFVALMPETDDPEAIAHTAERIIRAVEAPVPIDEGKQQCDVSASIGVACFPRDGLDFDALLEHADQAMYRAKERGRGRFEVYRVPSVDGHTWAAEETQPPADQELRDALRGQQIQLYFQPVIDTSSGRAVGAEALMRWRHPQQGLLQPAAFIHRAQESGQLHALELQTLEQACAQLAQWKDMGLRPGRISINVSSAEFRHTAWASDLGSTMARHGIGAGELAVELTESTLLGDVEGTRERLQALRQLGVSLVIDDFGSGLISLSQLGELRPAMLKLDASFIARLEDDVAARAMVLGVVGLARGLGIALVAEGVETEAQRDTLSHLGCHLQQGYLFARPQPALPEPAWPLPRVSQDAPWPRGANDSVLGDLNDDALPLGSQPPRGGRNRLA